MRLSEKPERYSKATADEARRLFSYSPDTGVLVRIVDHANQRKGSEAGCCDRFASGLQYRRVSVLSRRYRSHIIAWLLHYGKWPGSDIDHRDGNGENNRISNLRLSTHIENLMNRSMSKRNKTGKTGVCWSKSKNKWEASIRVMYKLIYLGAFEDFSIAVKAREDAEKKHGFSPRHGSPRVMDKGVIQ